MGIVAFVTSLTMTSHDQLLKNSIFYDDQLHMTSFLLLVTSSA